jgi:hypothetical protein
VGLGTDFNASPLSEYALQVHVTPKPVVALLSTGNEIFDLHGSQKVSSEFWGGIWDTNRPSLQTAIEGLGYRVIDLGIVHDKSAFIVLRSFASPSHPFLRLLVSQITSARFKRVLIPQI